MSHETQKAEVGHAAEFAVLGDGVERAVRPQREKSLLIQHEFFTGIPEWVA